MKVFELGRGIARALVLARERTDTTEAQGRGLEYGLQN